MDPSLLDPWGQFDPPPPSGFLSPAFVNGGLPGGSVQLPGVSLLAAPQPRQLFPTTFTSSDSLESLLRPASGQPPASDAAAPRRRKAPTLRDSDWEPMKARIVQLYVHDNLTIPQVTQSVNLEFNLQPHRTARQFLSRIQKWGLDKNNKPHESWFMARKQHSRRIHEPEKAGYIFRLRGQIVPPQKNGRYESRMQITQGQPALSPQSFPATPSGMSYWTGSPASSASSPAPATRQDVGGLGAISSFLSAPTSPLQATTELAPASPAPIRTAPPALSWTDLRAPIPTTSSSPGAALPSQMMPAPQWLPLHASPLGFRNRSHMMSTATSPVRMRLPSRWTMMDNSDPLQLDSDDLVVTVLPEAPPQPSLTIRVEGNVDICWVSNAFGVRADCPIPASMHQYYFEVEVIHRGVNVGFIAFGLAPVDSQGNLWGCERAPLIEGEFCLSNSGAGGFFEGDVMGFGVDVHTQTKFVTRNGMVTNAGPLSLAWNGCDEIYPMVVLGSAGTQVRTRFSPVSSFMYQRP